MRRFTIDGPAGTCPLQAEGEVDGCGWYFRARGARWQFSVTEPGGDPVSVNLGWEPGWHHEEPWDDQEKSGFGAGYMPADIALTFIDGCVHRFRAGTLPKRTPRPESTRLLEPSEL